MVNAQISQKLRLVFRNDLLKLSKWTYQQKIIFNPVVSKQAQEVVFF